MEEQEIDEMEYDRLMEDCFLAEADFWEEQIWCDL